MTFDLFLSIRIIPEPAHSVYEKTCQYVKTKWWCVPVNNEFQPDIKAIKKYINKNAIMVLCLDECTTNLDTKTTTELKDAIPSEHEGLMVIIIGEGLKEHHISRDDAEAADVDVHLYRSMIGPLIDLTASRPDIMHAVGACSRFQVTLKTLHLHVVKRIFRRLISLQCKKQTIMATSTTKEKYGRKKAKTRSNIKEGDFNKLDDLVDEGANYAVNEGRSTDKIKVLNAEAEGVIDAGKTLSATTLAVSTARVQTVLVLLKLFSY
nr:dihydrosphingosine phosphate lyase [Tanacetum cinerariifolium]